MNIEETKKKILRGERSQAVRQKLLSRTRASANVQNEPSLAQEVVQTVELPHPVYIDSAEGPYLTDLDGNQYLDLTGGFGPNILGNKPQVVEDAIIEQAGKGWHFGIPSRPQQVLSNIVMEASPCADKVVFCNSGTEATMYAMRAARAHTGKKRVATFEGSYHGVHDYALVKVSSRSDRSRPEPTTMGKGIPSEVTNELMLTLPYRNEAAFDIIREYKDELAMVMIEPAQSSNPRLDSADFLNGLRAVCNECDVLLAFDEVITGFRIAYGGCQEYYDIQPDLVTYGKAVGGGMPIGVVAGRSGVMDTFSGKNGAPYIFSGGTFSGNPLTMSAGIAATQFLKEHKEEIYPYLMEQGDRFAREINEYCELNQYPAQILNASSMLHLMFTQGSINSARDISRDLTIIENEFYLHLLGYDVLVPGIHIAFLSFAHRPEHVDTAIAAFKSAFEDLRADGLV